MFYFKRTLVLSIGLTILLAGCFSGSTAPILVTPIPTTNAPPSIATESDPPAGPDLALANVPLHPLSIETLRTGTFTGSDFVFEQTLEPGFNYNRYVVSYLSEGLKIYALLTIPQAERPATGYPVVIFNHGYIPPDQYRTTERYVAYVDIFARNGYIVVKSDYRGHGSSEGPSSSAYGSPAYTIDVLNGLASARRYPDADPNRVGMWGHSMGGYITLRAMVAQQDIKAGVIWAGVVASYSDLFQSWFRRGSSPSPGRSSWRDTIIETYGTPDDNPAFWASLSANSYLSELSGPIQIHHATGDTSVPVAYSVTLDEQIRAAGGTVETFIYQGDDHNIAANRDNALIVSAAFFNRYVKGN
jgi:uncharacterized protein